MSIRATHPFSSGARPVLVAPGCQRSWNPTFGRVTYPLRQPIWGPAVRPIFPYSPYSSDYYHYSAYGRPHPMVCAPALPSDDWACLGVYSLFMAAVTARF